MKCSKLILFLIICVVVTFAQNKKTAVSVKETKPASQSKVPVKKITAPEKQMYGMLVSSDKNKLTFTVKLRGKNYDFQANPSTKIQGKKGSVAFSDLKSGNAISVIYLKNKDSRTALSIVQNSAISVSANVKDKKIKTTTEMKPSKETAIKSEKKDTSDKEAKAVKPSSVSENKDVKPVKSTKLNETPSEETASPKKNFVKVDSIKASTPSVPSVQKDSVKAKAVQSAK